jgi:Family of unknown function (DUF6404)
MTHAEKVSKVISELRARDIGKMTIAPPAFQLAWKLGLKIPPPLFLGFFTTALMMGTFFGVFWGLFMWLAFWKQQGMSGELVLSASAAAGILFGFAMAGYLRWKARQLGLPRWSDCGKEG